MPHLAAVAAMRYLRAKNSRLQLPPLVFQIVDSWRGKGHRDNAVPLVRLQVAAAVSEVSEVHLSNLLPSEDKLPHSFRYMRVRLPKLNTNPTNPTRDVHEQLLPKQFVQLCKMASYDGHYAFIGPGNKGPDSWLVLQTVGGGGPLVLFIQSKKGSKHDHEQVKQEHLEQAAKKCWGKGSTLLRLLLYITDQQTDHVPNQFYVKEADLSVVVVGPKQHQHFYSNGVALVKRCIQLDAIHPKRARIG